jgi:pimeloyl-ACP methyl ester carboxylesterase
MPYASRDGVSLHYERLDAEDGRPPIIFVHGLGVARWLWQWQREAFEDEYDLVLPDNRGSGKSEAALPPLIPHLPRSIRLLLFIKFAGYSMSGLAADLEAVLADAGVDDVHLVGASLGGMIAQQYAIEYDRASTLSLLCTTHGGEESVPIPEETQERIFDVPEDADRRETIRHRMRPALTDEFYEAEPETIEQIIDWRIEQDADDAARESQAAASVNFDSSDRLAEIQLPTLVLHGSADEVLPVENGRLIHEKLPNSRLEILDDAPHMLMIEYAEAVNGHLREFFEEQ